MNDQNKYILGTTGPLQFELLGNGREVKLLKEFRVVTPLGEIVEIPDGFVTDFASVPRFFWRVIPPWGDYSPAAVIHDYLYASGKIDDRKIKRSEADDTFYAVMKQLGVSRWKSWLMHKAVRVGGWIGWNAYRALDKLPKKL